MATVKPEMHGLKQLDVLRAYCDYVEAHLRNVGQAWVILQNACQHEKQIWNDFDFWTIHAMIEGHDMSKMDAAEFTAYAEWFHGPYGKDYDGKDTDAHRKAGAAFSAAWEHHKAANSHHWQNWTRADERFPGEAACHLMCMVADWMAMGMTFGDTAEEYYEREKDNLDLPEWAVESLQRIFSAVKQISLSDCKAPKAGPLTDGEVNDWLHEAFGYCWHEWRAASSGMTCTKCGFRVPYHTDPPDNPNYCNDPILVLREMRKRDDYKTFLVYVLDPEIWGEDLADLLISAAAIVAILNFILDHPGALARQALRWIEGGSDGIDN